ncbi:tail fiber domain-containing protein [Shewanella baltica]|uniref:tail fiber domain-containing protein n=1 Tax=Shewanella baltica TaxID=62322 RepID=UPI003D7BBF45
MKIKTKILLAVIPLAVTCSANADVVHADDVIITSSACVGFDCVNGETFGFDTIKLKENNVRIKFDDTSSTGSFPSNDWQLTANDSVSGGANKFTIDDITSGKVPFTVIAGAPTNALYISNNGNVGLGTSSPVLGLHLVNGNTPAVRLEQNNSSGFTAQTWDVAGNESNFFIRDVTNGSKLPFKIAPGAPTNALYINYSGNIGIGTAAPNGKLVVADGNVGFGTSSPSTKLHVVDSTSATITSSSVLVENTNAGLNAVLLELKNSGTSYIKFTNALASPSAVGYWLMGAKNNGTFSLLNDKNFQVMVVDDAGNMNVKGTVTANNVLLTSDMNKKENFEKINSLDVLNAISKLAISKWNYKSQNANEQHIGPMAQDFYQLFGLGGDDKHISAIDSAGVSLAAIQALYDLNLKKDKQIEVLSTRIADLERKTK